MALAPDFVAEAIVKNELTFEACLPLASSQA
jgi:hypothetical protein